MWKIYLNNSFMCIWSTLFRFWDILPLFLVAKSCLTLCRSMNYSPTGSSVHGISQARILKWVAISFSRVSFQLRDWTHVSYLGRWVLYHWSCLQCNSLGKKDLNKTQAHQSFDLCHYPRPKPPCPHACVCPVCLSVGREGRSCCFALSCFGHTVLS